jgi:pimeloyl-ACP methyl ester carboxylesterase
MFCLVGKAHRSTAGACDRGGMTLSTHRTTTIPGPDGEHLALHDLGGGDVAEEQVLMVHATGLHGRTWDAVAAHLTGWCCHAVDLRGHGYSPLPAGADLDWNDFGRDAAAAADHLGPGLIGVGHSLGAVALLMAAVDHPERFDALVLYEPAMRATGGELPRSLVAFRETMVAMTRARRAEFPSRADALQSFARKPPFAAIAAGVLDAYVEHGFVDTPEGAVRLRCDPGVEAAAFARTHEHDLLDHLASLVCPVFVVRGDETSPLQIEGSDGLADIFGRPVRVVDGADHFGPLAQTSRFARIVREAVATIRS